MFGFPLLKYKSKEKQVRDKKKYYDRRGVGSNLISKQKLSLNEIIKETKSKDKFISSSDDSDLDIN